MKQNNIKPEDFTIEYLSRNIQKQNIFPTNIIEFCLTRIKKLNPLLNSFITVVEEEEIYNEAEKYEKEIKKGIYRGQLHGIPFTIKDIIHAKGICFTAGSVLFSKQISTSDATVVKKMKNSGAILMGTNNLNEFASGITGKNPFYGDSKNPWNLNCISGGSSSGSATAIASEMALASIGTDTGGSIRVPAALCGVVGFKPTYNIISRKGIFPLSPSLDHVGIITRTVSDAYITFQYIKKNTNANIKHKIKDANLYTNNKISKDKTIDDKVIVGIPMNYFYDFIHPNIKEIFDNFIETIILTKFKVKRIKLKRVKDYVNSWKVIRLSEASEIHQELMKAKLNKYSTEVKEMLRQGTRFTAIEYIRSLRQIKEIKKEFAFLFNNDIDAMITPTTIIPAPLITEDTIKNNEGDTIKIRDILLRNTIIFNSTGLPCISIPIGITKEQGIKLPIGLQITGKLFSENIILKIAKYIESKNKLLNNFIPPICNPFL